MLAVLLQLQLLQVLLQWIQRIQQILLMAQLTLQPIALPVIQYNFLHHQSCR
jgi:hypothetical protein